MPGARAGVGPILRSGALLGLFREVEPDCFELTAVSEGLRTDLPDGVRDAVLLDGTPMFWLPFGQLAHSARTGKPAFDAVFGESFWSHVDSDAHSGAVFDRPAVAGAELELGDAADRVTVRGGNFFADDLPSDCDTYLLKTVLHDWSDEDALRILAGVRKAAAPGARLLILEQVVAPMNEWDPAKFLDMDMLAIMGGRERALPDWRSLLDSAGFDLVNEPVVGDWAVLECVPRPAGA